MSDATIQLLTNYAGIASFIIAFLLFSYPVWRWFSIKRQEAAARKFEIYHRLIQELVDSPAGTVPKVHRQIALIFELRHFREYYAASYRIVNSLHRSWAAINAHADVLAELRLAADFFAKNKRWGVSLHE